jgi:hypothetical protein
MVYEASYSGNSLLAALHKEIHHRYCDNEIDTGAYQEDSANECLEPNLISDQRRNNYTMTPA